MARIRIIVEHDDDSLSIDVEPRPRVVRTTNAKGDVCVEQPTIGDVLRKTLSRVHHDMQQLIDSNWPNPPRTAPRDPDLVLTPPGKGRAAEASYDSCWHCGAAQ
jgi:hypothetical protein